MIDSNTIIVVSGLAVNLLMVFSFFTKLEHRLTKTETNLAVIMRRCNMMDKESISE